MSESNVHQHPREEQFENLSTGVEVETQEYSDEDERPSIESPWEPESIRVSTKNFSFRNILDMLTDGDMELAPDFQRNKVWKASQKSRLIESILLQIPLPAFYFVEDKEGMLRVVDGLQRLSTVQDFVDRHFKLSGLDYVDNAHGKYFDGLPAAWRRRIYNTQIVVHVIDPSTPADVKYDIFKRLNTLGTPLNSQEIRHCVSKTRSREFLKECTHLPEFDRATGGRLRDHVRMNDREMALRFFSFTLLGLERYFEPDFRTMDPFLEKTTEMLDDPEQVPDAELDRLKNAFRRAMTNAYEIFGAHAFRKWPTNSEYLNPINRPLFEAWSVTLADHELADVSARKKAIVASARDLMTTNADYLAAITSSTGDPRKVRCRFEATADAAGAGR